jgi:hypothetical protein
MLHLENFAGEIRTSQQVQTSQHVRTLLSRLPIAVMAWTHPPMHTGSSQTTTRTPWTTPSFFLVCRSDSFLGWIPLSFIKIDKIGILLTQTDELMPKPVYATRSSQPRGGDDVRGRPYRLLYAPPNFPQPPTTFPKFYNAA